MAQNYAYCYAEIDPTTNMCVSVITCTYENTEAANWVEIPYDHDDYLFKYYINGAWYEDAAGTIPWTPPV